MVRSRVSVLSFTLALFTTCTFYYIFSLVCILYMPPAYAAGGVVTSGQLYSCVCIKFQTAKFCEMQQL